MPPAHRTRTVLWPGRHLTVYIAPSKPPSAPPAFKHRGPIPATPRSGRPFTAQFALAQVTSDGETPHASAVGRSRAAHGSDHRPHGLCSAQQRRLRKSGSATAVTTSSSTELSSVASPVAGAVASEPDAVEYPERHWIAQSVWHEDGVRLAGQSWPGAPTITLAGSHRHASSSSGASVPPFLLRRAMDCPSSHFRCPPKRGHSRPG